MIIIEEVQKSLLHNFLIYLFLLSKSAMESTNIGNQYVLDQLSIQSR